MYGYLECTSMDLFFLFRTSIRTSMQVLPDDFEEHRGHSFVKVCQQ